MSQLHYECLSGTGFKADFTNPMSRGQLESVVEMNHLTAARAKKDPQLFKLYVRDPRELTDAEWLYIFGLDKRDGYEIRHKGSYLHATNEDPNLNPDGEFGFNVFTGKFYGACQDQLSRMYECKSLPRYEYLLDRKLIQNDGGIYEN